MFQVRLANFLDPDTPEGIATTIQTQTYRALQKSFISGENVTVGDLMKELSITKLKTFISRLDHLQAKGLIEYHRSTPPAT